MNNFAKILKGGPGSGRHAGAYSPAQRKKIEERSHMLLRNSRLNGGGKQSHTPVVVPIYHNKDAKDSELNRNAYQMLVDKGLVKHVSSVDHVREPWTSKFTPEPTKYRQHDHTLLTGELTDAGKAHPAASLAVNSNGEFTT